MERFRYGEDFMTSAKAMDIANGRLKAILTDDTIQRINQCASYVKEIVNSEQVVYGINTGFGPLCTTRIDAADTQKL